MSKQIIKLIVLISIIISCNVNCTNEFSDTDKHCLVLLEFSQIKLNSSPNGLSFLYTIFDTCKAKKIDSILISGGINSTYNHILYGVNCVYDSCALIRFYLDEFSCRYDTVFKWDYGYSQIPKLSIVQFVYSPFKDHIVFAGHQITDTSKVYGYYITRVKSLTELDTIKFVPYTVRATLSNDNKQIIFSELDNRQDTNTIHNNLLIYDIITDSLYNPLPDNNTFIYYPERMSRNSHIYYQKLIPQDNRLHIFRIIEGQPEERLTFFDTDYLLDRFEIVSDTSIKYWINSINLDPNIIEEKTLYLNK